MRISDSLQFSRNALLRYRFRSAMVLLAISLGVSSVVVLTALGEGARGFVVKEFSFLGKDVLAIFPGRNETTGGMPPVTGVAARDITLDEAVFLKRRLPAVVDVAPVVIGSAEVSRRGLAREVMVMGSSASFVEIRQLSFAQGRNLRVVDLQRGSDECLIGETLRDELFPAGSAVLGKSLRIADYRCYIVGVLSGRGDAMGLNLSDAVLLPVASAQRIFNTPGLFRLIVRLAPGWSIDAGSRQILAAMKELHQGEEDVTVVSPDAMLESFDNILAMMTLAVGLIAAISLLVAGVLIMNITLISVTQRTSEIGLLKALGASSAQVTRLFLIESVLGCSLGAVLGLGLAFAVLFLAGQWFPAIPMRPPLWAPLMAITVAVGSGLVFAWLPARRAASLPPITALQQH